MAKSLLLTIFMAILIVVGAGPYVMGMLSKSSIEKGVQALSYPPFYEVKIKEYHQGWLHSDMVLTVNSMLPFAERATRQMMQASGQKPTEEVLATIKGQVQHGPLIWLQHDKKQEIEWHWGRGALYTQMVYSPEATEFLQKNLKQLPLIHSTVILAFNGDYDWNFALEPLQFLANDRTATVANWQGIQGSWLTDRNINSIDLTANILPLSVTNNTNNSFQLNGAEISGKSNRNNTYHLWIGNSNLDIKNIKLAQHGNPLFEMDGLSIQQSAELKSDLVNGIFSLKLAKFDVMNMAYAPSTFTFNILNLDAKALGELVKLSQELQQNFDNVQKQQQITMQSLPVLMQIFSRGTELTSNIDWTTPQGKITGNVTATLAKPSNAGIGGIQEAFMNANVKVDVSAPKALVVALLMQEEQRYLQQQQAANNPDYANKTPQDLQTLAQTNVEKELADYQSENFISIDGDVVKIHATYQDQKVELNGKVFPLQQFLHQGN
ncbi:MAG: YdgA family protein [Legionellales bacterium]|nr:YdgA family protein [Legionellales bacterium]